MALGVAVAAGIGASKSFFWTAVLPELARAVRMDRRRVIAKKAMPIHVVNLASTFVVWDPKTLSVSPPPNAEPSPSLRGRCMRTTKIINTQTNTCRPIRMGRIIDIREARNLNATEF